MHMPIMSAEKRRLVPPLVALMLTTKQNAVFGLSIKQTFYADDTCAEETSASWYFGSLTLDSDANKAIEPFGVCYDDAFGGGSIMGVCDVTTGESGIEHYTDELCTELESVDLSNTNGCAACSDGTCGAIITTCSSDEPTALDPDAIYNLRATRYTDAECTNSTGIEDVLSGDIFGVQVCYSSYAGGPRYLESCPFANAQVKQEFSANDITCTGDVLLEWAIYNRWENSEAPCTTFDIDGFYYGYIGCTRDSPTLGVPVATAAPTPAPTHRATLAPTVTPTSSPTVSPTPAITIAPTTLATGFTPAPSPSSTATPAPSNLGVRSIESSGTSSPTASTRSTDEEASGAHSVFKSTIAAMFVSLCCSLSLVISFLETGYGSQMSC